MIRDGGGALRTDLGWEFQFLNSMTSGDVTNLYQLNSMVWVNPKICVYFTDSIGWDAKIVMVSLVIVFLVCPMWSQDPILKMCSGNAGIIFKHPLIFHMLCIFCEIHLRFMLQNLNGGDWSDSTLVHNLNQWWPNSLMPAKWCPQWPMSW